MGRELVQPGDSHSQVLVVGSLLSLCPLVPGAVMEQDRLWELGRRGCLSTGSGSEVLSHPRGCVSVLCVCLCPRVCGVATGGCGGPSPAQHTARHAQHCRRWWQWAAWSRCQPPSGGCCVPPPLRCPWSPDQTPLPATGSVGSGPTPPQGLFSPELGVGLPPPSVSAPPLIESISAQELDPASGLLQRAPKGSTRTAPES